MKNLFKVFGIITLVVAIGFSMAACDDGPNGPPGNYPTGGVPAAPTGLTASAISTTEISISWNAVANVSGYYIYYGASPSSVSRLRSTSYTSATHSGLSPNTTVYYYVTAYNANGESAKSNLASAKTSGGAPTTYSLDGTWESLHATIDPLVRVSGSTGVIVQISNWPLWKSAIEKGFVKVGDPYWKDITRTGDLTWSGKELHISYSSYDSNTATGTSWNDVIFSLEPESNGEDLWITYPSSGSMSLWSRK